MFQKHGESGLIHINSDLPFDASKKFIPIIRFTIVQPTIYDLDVYQPNNPKASTYRELWRFYIQHRNFNIAMIGQSQINFRQPHIWYVIFYQLLSGMQYHRKDFDRLQNFLFETVSCIKTI